MDYEIFQNEDFLIIKLSGIAEVNERLSVKEHLAPYLRHSKVIVDLAGLIETGELYIVGIMNTIRKEFQLLGGEVKFCAPKPRLHRHFMENRLDTIFDMGQSIEQIKPRFKEKNNEG
jgi:anti-anti-sigma regulatory factor